MLLHLPHRPPARPTVITASLLRDGLTAPTATSAWAFGWVGKNNGLIAPVARQWNGHRCSGATLPGAVKDSGMACAAASSPGNVWAFFGTEQASAIHPRPREPCACKTGNGCR